MKRRIVFGCGLFLGLYLLLKGIDFFQTSGRNIGTPQELHLFMVDVTELLPFQQPPITGTILLVMGSIIAALCFVAFLRTTHHEEQNQFDQKVK